MRHMMWYEMNLGTIPRPSIAIPVPETELLTDGREQFVRDKWPGVGRVSQSIKSFAYPVFGWFDGNSHCVDVFGIQARNGQAVFDGFPRKSRCMLLTRKSFFFDGNCYFAVH